jgi:uncharacterized protein (TIGR03437 family)
MASVLRVPGSSAFPLLLFLLVLKLPAAAPLRATSSSPTLDVTTLNVSANSLAWDPRNQQIYLSLSTANGATSNAIQVLDPATGALGPSVTAGADPNLLAVSANSEYLYVSLDGTQSVQRFALPNLTADTQFSLGSNNILGPLTAADLQASPVADQTVAVARNALNVDITGAAGVIIYDNGTPRSQILCGQIPACTGEGLNDAFASIQWDSDANTMYAAGSSLFVVPVSAAGFGTVNNLYDVVTDIGMSIHYDRVSGYVFTDSGNIVDPNAGKLAGTFGGAGVYNALLMVPDGALRTAFFLEGSEFTGTTWTLQSFDMQSLQPIAAVTISNVQGTPTHLIRWGTNGLAFTTTNSPAPGGAVYVVSGSFVGPAPGDPPVIMPAGIGPVYSSSTTAQPGEWISVFGSDLASGTAMWTGNFPTSLGGTSVTVDGRQAYLWYVSPGQINLQVPDDANTGLVPVVVTTAKGSTTSTLTLGPLSPSLLLLDSEHIAAIILRSDGTGAYGNGTYDILGPPGNSLGYQTVAAKSGDSVEIFAVGLGPTAPFVPAGQPFSGAAQATNPVTVTINNQNVTPGFAGLSGAGLYQINLTIPSGLGTGDEPITVSVAGTQTPSGDLISLQ